MKKIIIFLFFLLLLGGGCSNTSSEEVLEETTTQPTKTVENTAVEAEELNSIFLKVTSTGNATVEFEWKVPKNLESEEGYYIVYAEEPNPTYPSIWHYWRGPAHRSKVWSGLPLGTAHFRVCAVENKKCGEYSNNVEIEIK